MKSWLLHILATTGLLTNLVSYACADGLPLHYVDQKAIAGDEIIILDARPADLCEDATLPNARCLPAEDFLGLDQRLAGFANIAWVLGSAALTGSEKVLVIGGNPVRRDFVAGLLYIMGQKDISVLSKGVSKLKAELEPGEPRGMLRTKIWQAQARDEALVFVHELHNLLKGAGKPILLDGRAEKAYWGKEIKAARGGHLPGAQHFPASELRTDVARGKANPPVKNKAIVYGRGAVDGIAYMTLIMAGTGRDVRVFPGGWAKWASDGALPADAETHPLRTRETGSGQNTSFISVEMLTGAAAGLVLGGGLVLIGIWAFGRRKAV